MAGSSAVLTGSVRTPLDAKRAADIACQFVAANKDVGPSSAATQAGPGGTSNSFSYKQTSTTQSADLYRQQTQNQASACGGDSKLVINLLNIEGEEQVMLKVTISEVQRSLLKQFGLNIGAVVNSGNFTTALLSDNALPLTAAAGLGTVPLPGLGTAAFDITTGITCATSGILCNYNAGPSASSFGNSGVTTRFGGANTQLTQALRALERDGLIRTLAEPNLTAVSGETAKFLAGGEYPDPGRGQRRQAFGHLQGVRCRPRLHAGGAVGRPHQPAHRYRGQRADQRRRRGAVQHLHPGAQEAFGQVDRRDAVRRVAGHRGPDLGLHAPERRRPARPQGPAGDRHAVPQPRLHQEPKPSWS